MLAGLSELPVSATIVIGSDEGGVLPVGAVVGAGGEAFDPRPRPARGPRRRRPRWHGRDVDALIGPPGSLMRLPDMYMRRMAVGLARWGGSIRRGRLARTVAIAEAFGRNANDITALVLERPRHHDLIEEIRAAGARIKLTRTGRDGLDLRAIRGTNDHLAIGIGGTRQAVLSAAALRCSAASCRRSSGRRRGARDRSCSRAGRRGRESRLLLR